MPEPEHSPYPANILHLISNTARPLPNTWPEPPSTLPDERPDEASAAALVCVAERVRQRPDTSNLAVSKSVYEKFHRAVLPSRHLRVTGRRQRDPALSISSPKGPQICPPYRISC